MENISRREFLYTSLLSSMGLLSSCGSIKLVQSLIDPGERIYYSGAIKNPEVRDKYLRQVLERNEKMLTYIGELTYQEDPMLLSNDYRTGIGKERMERAYATVFKNPYNFGKGKKSEVYVFPKPFDELLEEEFKFCLKHEDNHCMNICEGVEIGGYAVDTTLLTLGILDELLELRGYYSTREKMFNMATLERTYFDKNVRPCFVNEMNGQYGNFYAGLKTKLEEGKLGDYDADVVREHLLEFDRWIKPEYRYRG